MTCLLVIIIIFTGDHNSMWMAEYSSAALHEQAKPGTCCIRSCNKSDPQIATCFQGSKALARIANIVRLAIKLQELICLYS